MVSRSVASSRRAARGDGLVPLSGAARPAASRRGPDRAGHGCPRAPDDGGVLRSAGDSPDGAARRKPTGPSAAGENDRCNEASFTLGRDEHGTLEAYGQPVKPRLQPAEDTTAPGIRRQPGRLARPRLARTLSASSRNADESVEAGSAATTGRPSVAAFADRRVERNLAEKRRFEARLAFAPAAAVRRRRRSGRRNGGRGRSSCSRRCRGSGTSDLPEHRDAFDRVRAGRRPAGW